MSKCNCNKEKSCTTCLDTFDADIVAALNDVSWGKGCDTIRTMAEKLMEMGYRKVL